MMGVAGSATAAAVAYDPDMVEAVREKLHLRTVWDFPTTFYASLFAVNLLFRAGRGREAMMLLTLILIMEVINLGAFFLDLQKYFKGHLGQSA